MMQAPRRGAGPRGVHELPTALHAAKGRLYSTGNSEEPQKKGTRCRVPFED